MIFYGGIVCGFAIYEYVHYRIHFAKPSCAAEERLRARHLAHHTREPDAIFGVTTRLWDVVFGTEPEPARMRELAAAGARVPVLTGHEQSRPRLSQHAQPYCSILISLTHSSSRDIGSIGMSDVGRHR